MAWDLLPDRWRCCAALKEALERMHEHLGQAPEEKTIILEANKVESDKLHCDGCGKVIGEVKGMHVHRRLMNGELFFIALDVLDLDEGEFHD